ncbi:MAG TPA: acyl-[acyl-carrier-protein] thioesterase, partial [Porphyromonadaceae bacterium]|nr:acyl-[acyl-carrier-protein] thioesterase [Porphyromonadaceae bacterium]
PSIPSPAKIHPVEGKVVKEYRVEYSDLDENRHMNTAKYAEHVFDLFPLEFFDKMRLSRLDMMFLREAKFGDMLQFVLQEMPNGEKSIEVRGEGGNAINRIKMSFVEREK